MGGRLAVLADIHGNYRALQAVLEDICCQRVEQIFALGDNIGYGPEPEEVVRALREHRVISVMGNHELGLISRSYYLRLQVIARISLDLTRNLLSQESLQWLACLPLFHVSCNTRFVHACPPQSITTYLIAPSDNRLQRLFTLYPEQICFAGHTHDFGFYVQYGLKICRHTPSLEQRTVVQPGRYLIQPGSVGQPRDMLNRHAKYMLWDVEKQTVQIRSVPYDVQTTVHLLQERGFPVSNAQRLL